MEYVTGGQVAVYEHYTAVGDRVTVRRVERITATQVVLEDGARYRRADGQQVAARNPYGPWSELRPLDDPQVRKVAAGQALSRLAQRVATLAEEMPRTAGPEEVLAALRAIEHRAAKARQQVEALTGAEEDER